jgi:hypothetical protein
MPREIYPSSYVCDCGYQSDHFENTIIELKRLSRRRQERLGSDDGAHTVVFDGGEMTAMWCPKVGKGIPANKLSHCIANPRRVGKQ